MNLLSEHNRILRVGEGGSQEYFPGPNINITDHVISGKYWDNEINSAISSTSGDIVNEAFNQSTAWTEEQGYLTAHQDVSNLPYVQNSALGYNGSLISSISGDGFFAESANNSYHADDADHATYADSATHADSADFVATANFANSASSALNAEVANVAYTALTAQFLDGGWELDVDGFITAYNNSAFAGAGGGGRYEGIEPIVVNNEEMRISAKSALLGVQDPLYFVEDSETATVIGIHDSAFPTFEGTPDGKISAINGSALNADPVVDYSAGNNIDITDYVISVTGSVPSADRADYAVSATSSHFSHSAIEAGSANYATESNHTHSADSATYDSLGRKIVDTYLTAHQELPDWTPTIQNASGNAYNSAVNWVVDQHYLTAVTGDNTPYSAGANIDITDHVVSGKDWTSEIQEASANAAGQIPDVTNLDYVQNSALNIANGSITSISSYNVGHPQVPVTGSGSVTISKPNGTVIIHGKEYDADISAASSYAYEQATAQIPDVSNLPYVQNTALESNGILISAISGSGLYATSADNAFEADHAYEADYVLSGWEYDDEDRISAYRGSAFAGQGGGQGVEYTGIAPIVVNNIEHKISAQSAVLGVQEPLYFVEDSETATIIGISGMPTVEGVMYESALGLSDGYITGYSGSAFSAERASYATSATSANGAISAQSANYVVSGWEISDGNITGYNGTAFPAGKTYTGISPVIVDNSLNTIAVSGYGLSGINLNIWKDDVNHVIVISASQGGASINYTTGSI